MLLHWSDRAIDDWVESILLPWPVAQRGWRYQAASASAHLQFFYSNVHHLICDVPSFPWLTAYLCQSGRVLLLLLLRVSVTQSESYPICQVACTSFVPCLWVRCVLMVGLWTRSCPLAFWVVWGRRHFPAWKLGTCWGITYGIVWWISVFWWWVTCFGWVLQAFNTPWLFFKVQLPSRLVHKLYPAVFETKLSMLSFTPQSKADSFEKEDSA